MRAIGDPTAAGASDVNGASKWMLGAVLPLAAIHTACEREPRLPEIHSAADLPAAMAWALGDDCRLRPFVTPGLGGCAVADARADSDPALAANSRTRVPAPRTAEFDRLAGLRAELSRYARSSSFEATISRVAWDLLWSESPSQLREISATLRRMPAVDDESALLALARSAVDLEVSRVEGTVESAVLALNETLEIDDLAFEKLAAFNRRLALEAIFGESCDDRRCDPRPSPSCMAILEEGVQDWARGQAPRASGSPALDDREDHAAYGLLSLRLRRECADSFLEVVHEGPGEGEPREAEAFVSIAASFGHATQSETGDLAAARREWTNAARVAHRVSPELTAYAESRVTWLAYELGDLSGARAAAMRGLAALPVGNPILRARLLWQLGTLHGAQGDWGEALALYLQALDHFENAGDLAGEAALVSRIAEIYLDGDAVDVAWSYLGRSLARLKFVPRGDRRAELLLLAERAARESGAMTAAEYFSSWAVEESDRSAASITHVVALQAQIALLALADPTARLREAEVELTAALQSISALPMRTLMEADGWLQRGRVATDRIRARELLTDAERVFVRAGLPDSASRAGLARIRLEVEAGGFGFHLAALSPFLTRAAAAFAAAPVEKRPGLRRDLDQLVEAALSQRIEPGDSIASLAIDQWERLQRLGARDASVEQIAQALESLAAAGVGRQIVVFRVTDTRLVRWSLRSGGWSVASLPVGRSDLRRVVFDFRERLAAGEGASIAATTALGELLSSEELRGAERREPIVILPDDALWELPWAHLMDHAASRPGGAAVLVALVVTEPPSLGPVSAGAQSDTTLLVRGVENSNFPSLGAIDSAEREAMAVTNATRGATVDLTGPNATKPAVLAALRGARRAHFSVHGVGAEGQAEGGLVLAASNGDLGVLSAQDLARSNLAHLSLVVLASCRSSRELTRAAGGVRSIAESFLVAGAGAAIASLGEVDDGASSEFFERLYSEIARGVAVEPAFATALRAVAGRAPLAVAPETNYQLYVRSAPGPEEGRVNSRRNLR